MKPKEHTVLPETEVQPMSCHHLISHFQTNRSSPPSHESMEYSTVRTLLWVSFMHQPVKHTCKYKYNILSMRQILELRCQSTQPNNVFEFWYRYHNHFSSQINQNVKYRMMQIHFFPLRERLKHSKIMILADGISYIRNWLGQHCEEHQDISHNHNI